MRPRVSPRCAEFAINPRPSDFINEIDGLEIVTCVDEDSLDCGPCDQRISIVAIASNTPRDAMSSRKEKLRGNIVPQRRNWRKREKAFTPLCYLPKLIIIIFQPKDPLAMWRHPGVCMDSRGPAMWPCVPCRIRADPTPRHVSSRFLRKNHPFLPFSKE